MFIETFRVRMRIRPKSWTRLINLAEPGFVYGWILYGSLTLQSELGFPFLSQLNGVGRKALIERQVRSCLLEPNHAHAASYEGKSDRQSLRLSSVEETS